MPNDLLLPVILPSMRLSFPCREILMPETFSFPCPKCSYDLQVDARMVQGVLACPGCGSHVAIPARDGQFENAALKFPPIEAAPEAKPKPEADTNLSEIKIKIAGPGEFLAVTALLVPIAALCVLFIGDFESIPVSLAISYGAVILSALLLGIDAFRLGTIDMQGKHRGRGIGLFFGMLHLWMIFYPVAFFRRRHFGRPNLGFLAILVTALFVGGPVAREWIAEVQRAKQPPECTEPEVVELVDKVIRQMVQNWPEGLTAKSISDHREIKHDRDAKIRRGRCTVELAHKGGFIELITVGFEVRVVWVDRNRQGFEVQIIPDKDDSRGYLGFDPILAGKFEEPLPLKPDEGAVQIWGEVLNPGPRGEGVTIIVAINNQSLDKLRPLHHFQRMVDDMEPGKEVILEVLRPENGLLWQRRQISVTVQKRPLGRHPIQ